MATKTARKTKPTTTTRSARRAGRVEEGPRYRVLAESFIDNRLVRAGEEVVYYGLPGTQLQPVNAAAKERKAAVRDVRLDSELDADEKLAQLRELSDEYNGVEPKDPFEESEAELDPTDVRPLGARNTEPLPAAERAELERQAQAALEAEAEKQKDDGNFTGVKLQGKLDPTEAEKQGATPVLDAQGAKAKGK